LPGKDGASAKPTRKRKTNRKATAAPPLKKPTQPWARVNSDQNRMLKP
jgi:hypothetical protein